MKHLKLLVASSKIGLVSFTFLLSGCVAAIPLAFEGVRGLVDYQSGQFKDVEMAPSRGYTREDIAQIEAISFSAKADAEGGSSGLQSFLSADTLLDNVTREFLKNGYDVFEGEVMQAIMEENGLKATRAGLAKAGRIAGVQAIATLRTETGQGYSRGVLGIGAEIKTGVLGASIRFIDPKTSKTMFVVTASYKKPKRAPDVAKNIAEAFKAYQTTEPDDNKTGG